MDGFQRKAARRVEALDGRAKLSFADNHIMESLTAAFLANLEEWKSSNSPERAYLFNLTKRPLKLQLNAYSAKNPCKS